MTADNLIQFPERGRGAPEEVAGARSVRREAERADAADSHLRRLSSKTRIPKHDRSVVARNLGRQLIQLDPENYREIAQIILGEYSAKRRRYIQYPSDQSKKSVPCAASGAAFAGIIQQLVDEKVKRGANRPQAAIETVVQSLKGTSFRPPPQFLGRERGEITRRDAATFVKRIEKVVAKLDEAGDLAEYLDLVSKYPVYPVGLRDRDPGLPRQLLILDHRVHANDTEWANEWVIEDELQNYIPWWAPKCVIGHLYVPFETQRLTLPEQAATEIRRLCDDKVDQYSWLRVKGKSAGEVQEYEKAEFVQRKTVWHRLPVWLVVLPWSGELVACLYVTIDNRVDEFQMEQSVQNETYSAYIDRTSPCFVDRLGSSLDTDATYFCDDWLADDSDYICATDEKIHVIGYHFDPPAKVFRADFTDPLERDLPVWLHDQPVAQLLKLSIDSEVALALALAPHAFTNLETPWRGYGELIFRPAFPDPSTKPTGLRQDSIGGYLLRNLAFAKDDRNLFEALRGDAIAKDAAVRAIVSDEVSKFQAAFDEQYGK